MNQLALFTKPWKTLPLPQLAKHVRSLGFDAIELPVRPGFPVEPDHIERDLPAAVRVLADEGLRVLTITAACALDDERLYAACAAAGVGMNRVMFPLAGKNYLAAEAAARRQLEAALPLCQQYQVQIGVQNHSRAFVPVHALGALSLLRDLDPTYAALVWDPAHQALEGMDSDAALDVVAAHLCMVNLKNAYWRRSSGPEAAEASWRIWWTSGAQGRASWRRVIAKLRKLDYRGPICFSAEYSDEERVDELIQHDLAYARGLLEE